MELIEELAARAALSDLKASYFRCVDDKDWPGLESLLTEDCTFSVPDDFDGVEMSDRDDIVRTVKDTLVDCVSAHHGFIPEFTFHDANSASGIWKMEDYLWVGEKGNLPVSYLHGFGSYHDDYVRIDGEWKIKKMTLYRDKVETRPR